MQKAEKEVIIPAIKTLRERMEQPITPEILAEMKQHVAKIEAVATHVVPMAVIKSKVQRSPTYGFYTGNTLVQPIITPAMATAETVAAPVIPVTEVTPEPVAAPVQ